MDKNTISNDVKTALMMYANEPCRICGETITEDQVYTAKFAGYSKNNEARAAHKECWEKYPTQTGVVRPEWVYQ